MPAYPFVTLDVFTHERFGGNPLAVFTDARGLSDADMQSLAREIHYSETTFVLPPEDPAHTARMRIFTPTLEMPFAGHPSVGTGFVLAQIGGDGDALTLEVPAGVVEVKITRDGEGAAQGGVISAPRPLTLGEEMPVETVAGFAGLDPADIIVTSHNPIEAGVGVSFFVAEVTSEALTRAAPDLAAFRKVVDGRPDLAARLSLHLYARDGATFRTRMFAPLDEIPEDPATGSANAALSALLLSLGDAANARFDIVQGVEMGRPSRLTGTAARTPDGIRATIGGGCVMMMRGEAVL